MNLAALALLALLQAAPAKGSIDGVVLRAGSDDALPGTQVLLMRAGATTVTIAPVSTDDRGRFHFGDLEPGTYRVTAAHNGFVRQEYGQRSAGRPGLPLEIAEGQAVKDLVFRLAATGTVTGRVTDSGGLPLTGANVVLLRALYDSEGQRSLQPVISVRTDDRGEYRLFWITPGRYYLNANASRPYDELTLNNPAAGVVYNGPPRSDGVTRVADGALYNPNGVVDQAYASTFYVQTTDPTRATPINVQPGMELGGINFILQRERLAGVRGRLVDGAYGQAPRGGGVTLRSGSRSLPTTSYDRATGQFEIRDVPPGTYDVTATMLAPNPATTSNTTLYTRLEVTGADIDNLVFTLRRGSSVTGRLVVETIGNPSDLAGFGSVTLRMPLANNRNLGPYLAVGRDGTITATEVAEGEYRFTVGNLPGNTYVKSIRVGSNEIYPRDFKVPLAEPSGVEIVLNPNGGLLTGTTSPNAQVALVPTQRERHELYREAISDREGRFTIRGIAPGEYSIFAWENLEPYSYHDPEILRAYETSGKRVQVMESSSQTVVVVAIP